VVAGANDGTVHACVDPTSSSRANGGASPSDPVSCISLFKKTSIVTSFTDVSRPIATMTQQQWDSSHGPFSGCDSGLRPVAAVH
jgi:hypothetical protein